jgi:hypothetical protein
MGVLLLMAEHKETLAVKVKWAEMAVAAEEVVPENEGKMAVAETVETAETAKYQASRGRKFITPVAVAGREIYSPTSKDRVGGAVVVTQGVRPQRAMQTQAAVAAEVHGIT